jgi:hypothetical protein
MPHSVLQLQIVCDNAAPSPLIAAPKAPPSPYVAVKALAVCHILQQHLTGMQAGITKPEHTASTGAYTHASLQVKGHTHAQAYKYTLIHTP